MVSNKVRYKNLSGKLYLLLMLGVLLPALTWAGDFSGEWRSSLGKLTLSVKGTTVSGVYTAGNSEGTIRGLTSANGNVLTARWSLDGEEGRLVFRLWSDGNAFAGHWWYGDTRPGGDWIGVRPDKALTEGAIKAGDFSGEWYSNYGTMQVTVSGKSIVADFKGKRNQGTISGDIDERTNKLVGSWKDTDHKGRLIFKLLKGGNGFLGEWWYEDNEYGGFWYGVRALKTDGCISGDCETGKGTYIWGDGTRYRGDWQNKLPHGMGAQYDSYGRLRNNGVWAEGIYLGKALSGNCQEGSGSLEFPNGERYEGEFQNCTPDGNGMLTFLNGDRYRGQIKEGLPHGDGSYIWAVNGDSLSGVFRRGKIRGIARYYFSNGDRYEGAFRLGRRAGRGTMEWRNRDRYEGNWVDDQMNGSGTYTYANGDVYRGDFQDGLLHGEGVYTVAGGQSFRALWKAGMVEIRLDAKAPSSISDSSSMSDSSMSDSSMSDSSMSDSSMSDMPDSSSMSDSSKADSSSREGSMVSTPLPAIQPLQNAGSIQLSFLLDPPPTFLVYRSEELQTEDGSREALLTYYVVYGQETTTEDDVLAFFQEKTGITPGRDYRIDKISQVNTRVKQLLNRLLLSPQVRASVFYGGYYTIGE